MIRSLDTLGGAAGGQNHGGGKFRNSIQNMLGEANKDEVDGWAPEIEILSE